nr:MAG TPA: hypothetical protein [Caudoviricetes sp.]
MPVICLLTYSISSIPRSKPVSPWSKDSYLIFRLQEFNPNETFLHL